MYNQFVPCRLVNVYITRGSSLKNELDRRH